MKTILNKIKETLCQITSFLFADENCSHCNKSLNLNKIKKENIICCNCFNELKKTIPISFYFSKNKVYVYSLTLYEGKIKKILHSKYYKNENPYYFFGEKMADYFLKYNLIADYIIPIPQHFIKKCTRQFNQSEILAKEISKKTNIKFLKCLHVKKYYKSQNKIKIENRNDNVKNVFGKNKNIEDLNDKTLCIVDDIYTSGSTIKEAIRSLNIKNSKIIIFVIAKCIKTNA